MRQEPAGPKTGLPPPNGHQSRGARPTSHKINSTKKIKNTKTAEQWRAQAEQLQASIADQVD